MPTIQVRDPAAVPELPVRRGHGLKGHHDIAVLALGLFLAFSRG